MDLSTYGETGVLMANKLQGSLAAIDLTTQQAIMSAVANDTDPRLMYAQQLWGLGREGDVLIGISTSGNAENVLAAGIAAAQKGMKTISLTGAGGGKSVRLRFLFELLGHGGKIEHMDAGSAGIPHRHLPFHLRPRGRRVL